MPGIQRSASGRFKQTRSAPRRWSIQWIEIQTKHLYCTLKRLKARSITIGPICCDWRRMCRVGSISRFHSENIKGLSGYRYTAQGYTPQVRPSFKFSFLNWFLLFILNVHFSICRMYTCRWKYSISLDTSQTFILFYFSFIRYMYQIGPVMKPFLVFAKYIWWYYIP